MQEIMNGKMMHFPHPGATPHHALAAPHNAYMPMPPTMGAATFAPNLSPNSSVLMTPKSACTPPSHTQLIGKQPHPFIPLHHPAANHTPTQHSLAPYGHSHSAPWSAQSQFVFPPTAAMSFSNPPPLTNVSCSPGLVGTTHAVTTIPAAPHQW